MCSVLLQLVATSNESYLNLAYLTLVRDPENMLIHIVYLVSSISKSMIKYDHMKLIGVQGKSMRSVMIKEELPTPKNNISNIISIVS